MGAQIKDSVKKLILKNDWKFLTEVLKKVNTSTNITKNLKYNKYSHNKSNLRNKE